MSLALAIVVALAGGMAAIVLGPRMARAGVVVSVVAAAATLILGLGLGPDTSLVVGHSGLQASDPVRMLVVAWAGGLLLAAVVPLVEPSIAFGAMTVGAGLVALAAATLALSVDDPAVAVTAVVVGSIAAVTVPAVAGWSLGRDDASTTGIAGPAMAAAAGSGLVALVLVAWSQSSGGPLGNGGATGVDDPAFRTIVGIAIVGMAGLVAVRSGAIPAHLWAARLAASMSPLALPAILAWGSAAFTLVALGWASTALAAAGSAPLDDLDRFLVIIVALASIAFGGLAAMLHDDLEHVLGYSIVQDAGVSLLAFASLRPEVVDAAASWLIASASVKTALAGWVAVTRWAFGTHRLSELRGWARRAPALGAAFAIVILASVGLPGMALFDARVRIVSGAVSGWLVPLVVIVALSPLLALGRLLATGLERPSVEVAGASEDRVGRLVTVAGGWSAGGPRWWLRTAASLARANEGLGVAMASVLLAILGLAVAIVGAGSLAAT